MYVYVHICVYTIYRERIDTTLEGTHGCHQFFDDDSQAMLFTVREFACLSKGTTDDNARKLSKQLREGHKLFGPMTKRYETCVCVCVCECV